MNKLFQFKSIWVLALVFCIIGCQREDELPFEEPPSIKRMVVTSEDIPDVKSTLLQKIGIKSDAKLFSANNGDRVSELSIDWDHIKQLIDTTGRETYAFGIEDNDPDPRVFYNLIIRYNEDHEAHQPFLLRYKMDDDFLLDYIRTNSLQDFRGTTQKIPIKSGSKTPERSRAFLDGNTGGISVDDPCPNENPVNSSGGGNDPGSGGGPTYECSQYLVTTTWYSQTCTRSGCEPPVEVGQEQSIVTECGWVYENNAANTEDDCRQETGEIPIVSPDQPDKGCSDDPMYKPEIAAQTGSGQEGGRFHVQGLENNRGDTTNVRNEGESPHRGIDLLTNHGDKIYSILDNATVAWVERTSVGTFGIQIAISGEVDGVETSVMYAHLSGIPEGLNVGDSVDKNTMIGIGGGRLSNGTWTSTGTTMNTAISRGWVEPHVHIEVREGLTSPTNRSSYFTTAGRAAAKDPEAYIGTYFDEDGVADSENCLDLLLG